MPKFKWYYPLLAIPFYLISLLPMFVLHGLSDVARFLFFSVFNYRKQVVFQNLRNAFPQQNEDWIKQIAYKFYQNLFDTIVETIAMVSLSKNFYKKHVRMHNLEVIHALNQQPFILVCGHLANWEWAGQGLHQAGIQVDVLYHPLSNKWFNWFMYHIRSRYGIYPIAMQSTLREMLKRKQIPSAITFIADQTAGPDTCHWMTFLNQDTPVFLGVEKMAQKCNYPIIYGDMYRDKRGYYDVYFKLLTLEPNSLKPFEITRLHTQMLEESILKKPEDWLWSHKRWKHKRTTNHEKSN
jgi:KDO2-lipid IV(A) lauroyltransferase